MLKTLRQICPAHPVKAGRAFEHKPQTSATGDK
jgi:hypothetical protein